jgi:hypothetical protein
MTVSNSNCNRGLSAMRSQRLALQGLAGLGFLIKECFNKASARPHPTLGAGQHMANAAALPPSRVCLAVPPVLRICIDCFWTVLPTAL